MSLNDRASWGWADPCPDKALVQIEVISLRAHALVSRSPSPLLREHFIQIAGVVDILSGLDYHFSNFKRYVKLVQVGSEAGHAELRHEAVAWVNRTGQLHYFVTSHLVKGGSGSIQTPAIDAVLPFRHKHTAHRSSDSPRKSDTAHVRTVHAMSLSILGGTLWTPRKGHRHEPSYTSPADTHFLTFQIQEPVGTSHDLSIEQAHP